MLNGLLTFTSLHKGSNPPPPLNKYVEWFINVHFSSWGIKPPIPSELQLTSGTVKHRLCSEHVQNTSAHHFSSSCGTTAGPNSGHWHHVHTATTADITSGVVWMSIHQQFQQLQGVCGDRCWRYDPRRCCLDPIWRSWILILILGAWLYNCTTWWIHVNSLPTFANLGLVKAWP